MINTKHQKVRTKTALDYHYDVLDAKTGGTTASVKYAKRATNKSQRRVPINYDGVEI